jgi:predicted AAA+ superfamily ATPase
MRLKPRRDVAVSHENVLKGTFQQADFAADLSRVYACTAAEYQNPALFFQCTFITECMRLLLDSMVKRLRGRGGGKTHTMLAVYHLASGKATASDISGISAFLNTAGVAELPHAAPCGADGIKSSPNQPVQHGATRVRTLWGDLAWQLGGAERHALVADASGTSPGKAVLG